MTKFVNSMSIDAMTKCVAQHKKKYPEYFVLGVYPTSKVSEFMISYTNLDDESDNGGYRIMDMWGDEREYTTDEYFEIVG